MARMSPKYNIGDIVHAPSTDTYMRIISVDWVNDTKGGQYRYWGKSIHVDAPDILFARFELQLRVNKQIKDAILKRQSKAGVQYKRRHIADVCKKGDNNVGICNN